MKHLYILTVLALVAYAATLPPISAGGPPCPPNVNQC